MLDEIKKILEERGAVYGEYAEVAFTSQALKSAMHSGHAWWDMPDEIKESLEMVANKISRMVNGSCMHEDNILDIMGYMQLALDRVRESDALKSMPGYSGVFATGAGSSEGEGS